MDIYIDNYSVGSVIGHKEFSDHKEALRYALECAFALKDPMTTCVGISASAKVNGDHTGNHGTYFIHVRGNDGPAYGYVSVYVDGTWMYETIGNVEHGFRVFRGVLTVD